MRLYEVSGKRGLEVGASVVPVHWMTYDKCDAAGKNVSVLPNAPSGPFRKTLDSLKLGDYRFQ